MSSYRPRSYGRPLHRNKSRWKTKALIVLLLLAGGWFGVPALWGYVKKKLEPRTVTVTSQEEAMNRLKGVLACWDMPTEELKTFAHQIDQKLSWMENERARDTAKALLAVEMDVRGLGEQSQPMIIAFLEKRVKTSANASPEEKKALAELLIEWGDRFARRGDDDNAERLYMLGLNQLPKGEDYFLLLSKAIDLKQKSGDLEGTLKLIGMLDEGGKVVDLLKSPEHIRAAAGYQLFADQVRERMTGQASTAGEEAAYALLRKSNLNASPEMGRILLSRLKGQLNDVSQLPQKDIAATKANLEQILGCFRTSEKDMVYMPEIMISMARLYDREDDVQLALLWANRAEGIAMVLGVDTPRILQGQSIREAISSVRNSSREKLKKQEQLQRADGGIRNIELLLGASEWDKALKEIENNRALVADTAFMEGYLPVLAYQSARCHAGQQAWPRAGAEYAAVLTEWKNLPESDMALLTAKLERFGYPDLYKIMHRELAGVYARQDMITRANETIREIGEELPKQGTSSRRNSR